MIKYIFNMCVYEKTYTYSGDTCYFVLSCCISISRNSW